MDVSTGWGRNTLACSIVIPTYNEEETIISALQRIEDALSPEDIEMIVSDDGSTDRTVERVLDFSSTRPWIRLISSDGNMGRGEAVAAGFAAGKGAVLAFLDADMATDFSHFGEMLGNVGPFDICIGSRWLEGSVVQRSVGRLMISKAFNLTVALLFHSRVSDNQCGFKAFKREVGLSLVRDCGTRTDRGWLWDTEMLVRAQLEGFSIKEIPVTWRAGRRSKFSVKRDIIRGLRYLIALKLRLIREYRYDKKN